MFYVAFKMLVGDRAKYITLLAGLTLSIFLIMQMGSVFVGLMRRTSADIRSIGAELWITDPKLQFIDDLQPMLDSALTKVRSVPGVEWAVPVYIGNMRARLPNGNFQAVHLIGLDTATLAGRPPEVSFRQGRIEDLYEANAVLLDRNGLAKLNFPKVGDVFELNDHEARVVGIVDVEPNFFANPIVYTTYDRALQFTPTERKRLTFVLAKPEAGYTVQQVAAHIRRQTELAAYTKDEMVWKTIWYYMKNTGIGINIGMVTFLAFLVGIAIAGQTFYAFTLENLKQFGALKAMGTSNATLLGMILLQSLIVGFIGYGLGVGLSAWVVMALLKNASNFAAFTPYQLLLIAGGATLFICMFASVISLSKVLRLEPAIVFRG